METAFGLALAVGGFGALPWRCGEQAIAEIVEEGQKQVTFGVEVLVEDRFGDSDGLGDIVHRGAVETLVAKTRPRREQLLSTSGGGQA